MGELLEFIWSQKQTLPQLLTLLCRLLPYTTPITSDTMKKYFCLPRMMLLKFHTATNCKRKQISGYSWNMLLCVILTCLQHLSNYDVKGALQASAAEGLYSRKSEIQIFPKKPLPLHKREEIAGFLTWTLTFSISHSPKVIYPLEYLINNIQVFQGYRLLREKEAYNNVSTENVLSFSV